MPKEIRQCQCTRRCSNLSDSVFDSRLCTLCESIGCTVRSEASLPKAVDDS
jgi:hypothetical protein